MHADMGRYWYSMSASLNRVAADRAEQIEEALVQVEIDKALTMYVGGLGNRGHFDTVQVAPSTSADIPDEADGVRAVVLGIKHPHNGRDDSEAMAMAKGILEQRGSMPRVYRNLLVFLAAETRQLGHLREAMRSMLAWESIVRDTDRLNLTQRDSALAKEKSNEAKGTVSARLMEAWCYLLYPRQDSPEADISWISGRFPARDGLLQRASKRLIDEEGLLLELGTARLDRDLDRYLWRDNHHLSLKDLREYLDRYTYLPRVKDRSVLVRTVTTAIRGLLAGPFAYAESWEETTSTYQGLAISNASDVNVIIDNDSVIVRPDVAEAHRQRTREPSGIYELDPSTSAESGAKGGDATIKSRDQEKDAPPPTRFTGTVEISTERPGRDIRQVIESVVEQLTTIPNSEVKLILEIDAEVPTGISPSKVRTLIENANTLRFTEKSIR